MSMESELSTLLKTACPRAFPDVAPAGTAKPWVTWQQIGGTPLRYFDSTAMDKRHALVQTSAWALNRIDANTLARQIEDVLCASLTMTVEPVGELVATHEPDTGLYGAMQRFSIYISR